MKTGNLFTIHVFSRTKKIVFFSEILLKLIKIFDSDYVTYIVRGLGPVFPDILFLRRVSGYYFHPALRIFSWTSVESEELTMAISFRPAITNIIPNVAPHPPSRARVNVLQ